MKNLFQKSVFMLGSLCLAVLFGSFVASAAGAPDLGLPLGFSLFALGQIPVDSTGTLAMSLNAKNILWPQGRLNPGGTANKILYANVEDILEYPAAMQIANIEAAETYEGKVTIPEGDPFIMKPGKYFHELYSTIDEGEIKSGMVGPNDGKSFENMGDGSFPGSEAEFLGWIASYANRDIVAIYPERNGNNRVIGSPFYPGKLDKADYTSGKKTSDGRAFKFTIKDANGTPAPIYKALIPLEPAVAPPAPSLAAVITTQPGGAGLQIGQNVEIKVVATNVKRYKWFKDNVEIMGVGGDVLTLLDVRVSDAGNYHVVITGLDNGTITSVDANLNVS